MNHIKNFESFDKVDESIKSWIEGKIKKYLGGKSTTDKKDDLKGDIKKVLDEKEIERNKQRLIKRAEADKIISELIDKVKDMDIDEIEKKINIQVPIGGVMYSVNTVIVEGERFYVSLAVRDELFNLLNKKNRIRRNKKSIDKRTKAIEKIKGLPDMAIKKY